MKIRLLSVLTLSGFTAVLSQPDFKALKNSDISDHTELCYKEKSDDNAFAYLLWNSRINSGYSKNIIPGFTGKNIFSPGNEIHLGVHYVFNSTWIMNQNTYGQFKTTIGVPRELNYKFSFGSAYSITGGCDFGRKNGFETGIIFNSVQGQKYFDRFSGFTVYREVNLKYMNIPLLYKRKILINRRSNQAVFNVAGGIQYGRIKFAEEYIDSTNINGLNGVKTTDIKNRFRKNGIAFVMNFGFDYYLNKYFFATLELNSSISNDINAKGWPVKDDYGRSHNLLIGINIGLNYYFKFQKKNIYLPDVSG